MRTIARESFVVASSSSSPQSFQITLPRSRRTSHSMRCRSAAMGSRQYQAASLSSRRVSQVTTRPRLPSSTICCVELSARRAYRLNPIPHLPAYDPGYAALSQSEHPPYLVLLQLPDEVQVANHASRTRVHVPVMTLRFHLHGPPSLVRVTNGATSVRLT